MRSQITCLQDLIDATTDGTLATSNFHLNHPVGPEDLPGSDDAKGFQDQARLDTLRFEASPNLWNDAITKTTAQDPAKATLQSPKTDSKHDPAQIP